MLASAKLSTKGQVVIPKAVRVMVPEGAKPAGIRAQILRALR